MATVRLALVVLVVWPGTLRAQSAPKNVLDRTADYVAAFVRGFSNVVAEERYVQTSNYNNRGPGRRRRELVSDFLLVKGQDEGAWYQFRDVRLVDGGPIVDRDRRLTQLFLQPWDSAFRQALTIAHEASRYNLVDVGAINFPLVAIALFQPSYRDRFEFSVGKVERESGRDLRVISFQETEVSNPVIGGMRSSGRAWVDETTGRVMKTELQLRHPAQRYAYKITTTFAVDDRLRLAVPVEMRDSYPGYLDMTGIATYGQFRSFQVRTAETLR